METKDHIESFAVHTIGGAIGLVNGRVVDTTSDEDKKREADAVAKERAQIYDRRRDDRYDKLVIYRKNARKSMRQMQAALERKNLEIAKLKNEVAQWVIHYGAREAELGKPMPPKQFWSYLLDLFERRK